MPSTFQPAQKTSTFRQLAASMWGRPSDPTIYGFVDVDMTQANRFIEEHRAATGKKLTVTHLVTRAVARAYAKHPELNAKVRFGGRVEERSSVDLLVSVSTGGGKDLSAARVEDADKLDLDGLVDAVSAKVKSTRNGDDETYQKSRSLIDGAPWWLVRPALGLTDFLSNELNLHLPKLGMPRDPFGTAVITNVGMFGIDTAFAPFVPMGRCSMLLLITEVRDRPVVVDGRVEARPVLRLCASFDHRIVDGLQAGRLAREITSYLEDPESAADSARAEPSPEPSSDPAPATQVH